jgi:hypothetical protein
MNLASEPFSFRFDPRFRVPLSLLGVRPSTSQVRVGPDRLEVDYGPWHLASPWSNVLDVRTSGPFQAVWAIGPRLSLTDRGATFGTATHGGVCIRFRDPVGGLAGPDRLHHPGLTVTVSDPEGLVAAIEARVRASS